MTRGRKWQPLNTLSRNVCMALRVTGSRGGVTLPPKGKVQGEAWRKGRWAGHFSFPQCMASILYFFFKENCFINTKLLFLLIEIIEYNIILLLGMQINNLILYIMQNDPSSHLLPHSYIFS